MLSLLRRKKTMKRILWVLAAIIIPAFVLWGAGSSSKRKLPYSYIGTINNRKVTIDNFIKSIENVQISLFLNYFNKPEALNNLQQDRALLNRLAWENLVLKSSIKKGEIKVTDKEVIDFVTHHPLFTRGRVFDDNLYKYILKNSVRIAPREFEESVRSFLINMKKRDSIVQNVTVSDDEILKAYENENEKAKIYYIMVDKKGFEDRVSVSPSEISSFYETNKAIFQEPEKAILQYVEFPHKEKGTKDSAIRNLKSFYEKIYKNPKNMEKVSEKFGLTIKETAPFAQNEIVVDMEGLGSASASAFRLEPLVEILPFVSDDEEGTSYIIRVKEKIAPRIKEEELVSGYIANIIKDGKSLQLVKDKMDKIYEEIESNDLSLKNVSKKFDLSLQKTDFISRYDYIEEVGEAHSVIGEALKLKEGEVSKPIPVRKGFVLVEPIGFLPINTKDFEKEKDDYENRLLSTKKMKAIEDWFNKANLSTSLNVDLNKI